jgi:hypothetical protein
MSHKGGRLCIVILALDKQVCGKGRILIFLGFLYEGKSKALCEDHVCPSTRDLRSATKPLSNFHDTRYENFYRKSRSKHESLENLDKLPKGVN